MGSDAEPTAHSSLSSLMRAPYPKETPAVGTTTNFAFPYPAATDAADGPTQIQSLATAVDTKLQSFRPLYAVKSADENVTSSITFQTDDHLVIASIPTGSWELSGEVWFRGDVNGDIKIRFNFPTGTLTWSGASYHSSWTNSSGLRDAEVRGFISTSSPTSSSDFGCSATPTQDIPIQIKGRLVNSAIGTLSLDWAQSVSSATATTVKAESWLMLRRYVIP